MTDRCASYNWEIGELPQVALPKPAWSDRNGDTIMIDHCIAPAVKALWDLGYITLSSCCGHGRETPSLVVGNSTDGSPEKLAAMRAIIANVDGRDYRLYQWQLVEV